MGGAVISGGLEHVRDRVDLIPDAAAAFRRANAQVRQEFGRDIDVNRTSTAWDVQLGMYNAWNRYVASGYNRALYPGHSKAVHPSESFHVYDERTGKGGIALDSDDWVNARIDAILGENGFIRNRLHVPGENHHYEWLRDRDQNYGQPASGGNSMEEDMVNVSEAQLQTLLEGARAATHTRELTGGSIENADQVIPLLRRAVKAAEATYPNVAGARSILGGSTADRDGDGKQDEPGVIARLRTILAVVQQLAKSAGISFDYEAFAAELAPYLELRTLSDGDLQAIAAAAADEQDRRDRERLGTKPS